MNSQEHKILNRREIEEAIEILLTLPKNGFFNIPKVIWWLTRYEEVYNYSSEHRHDGSCIDGIGCKCSWEKPESKFCDLYSTLEEITNLYQYEKYFEKEMEVFEQVRNDYPALMQWLKKNEQLGTEEFILFWIEWYEDEEDIVKPFILNWQNINVKFTTMEWQHTVRFLKIFNQIYWTSDACPPMEKLK